MVYFAYHLFANFFLLIVCSIISPSTYFSSSVPNQARARPPPINLYIFAREFWFEREEEQNRLLV